MKYHKPRKQALYVWWTLLFFIALVLCTLISFIFTLFGKVWLISMSITILLFCFFFSVYFPKKLKNAAFNIEKDNLIIYSGVFNTKVSYVRLENVQFVTKYTSILNRFFNISSAFVWTAGGMELVFGLSNKEADQFIDTIARKIDLNSSGDVMWRGENR